MVSNMSSDLRVFFGSLLIFTLIYTSSASAGSSANNKGEELPGFMKDDDHDDFFSVGAGVGSGNKKDDPILQTAGRHYEPMCKPAFVKGDTSACLLGMRSGVPDNQWGWTNRMRFAWEKMPLYAGADSCDESSGVLVGYVRVVLWNYSVINMKFVVEPGWVVNEWRVFVSDKKMPVSNNQYILSPFHEEFRQLKPYVKSYDIDWPGIMTYISIYAEVCQKCDDSEQTPVVKVISHEAEWNDSPRIEGKIVQEGMNGWEVGHQQTIHHNIPPVLVQPNMLVHFPQQQDAIPSGNKYRFYCPKNCDDKPCEVIIVHYHCPPCSKQTNGDLPHLFPTQDWTPGHCGPQFTSPATGDKKHRTVSFRKLIKAGDVEDTPDFVRTLSNTAAYVRTGAMRCDNLEKDDCLKSDECRYNAPVNECVSNWCPPPQKGPLQADRSCEPCAPLRK